MFRSTFEEHRTQFLLFQVYKRWGESFHSAVFDLNCSYQIRRIIWNDSQFMDFGDKNEDIRECISNSSPKYKTVLNQRFQFNNILECWEMNEWELNERLEHGDNIIQMVDSDGHVDYF